MPCATRAALGVRTIVDDGNVYDQLKLLARFVRLAGFAGTIVCCDELVNLYKLANTKARNTNYEQILRILNDYLQGSAEGLGFLLGGTPEFLLDTRRGLYSYQALQSMLRAGARAGQPSAGLSSRRTSGSSCDGFNSCWLDGVNRLAKERCTSPRSCNSCSR
jgi:P-loop Domain of unknown function (DUF2791)